MNTPRARAISEYLASGIWDEYGEYNFDTDPEDYGYFQAEGRAVLPRRSELKQELYNNSTEEAEDAEYFRLVEEEQANEDKQRMAQNALSMQEIDAAWNEMTLEQQEAALREGSKRIAKRYLDSSRDESRSPHQCDLFFYEAVRRSQELGVDIGFTEEEHQKIERMQEERRKIEG